MIGFIELGCCFKTLSVAGFGKTETRSASNLKLKVNVNGVSNEDCNKVYSREQREIIDTQVIKFLILLLKLHSAHY